MGLRDSWCTPRRITRRLPEVDLDPCSNPRSTVKAKRTCMLERGENGLLESWEELSVFVNPPWSDPLPFAIKAWEADSFCFLVKEDPTTEWWSKLTAFPCYRFSFNFRVPFEPPEDVEESTNEHPSCLICCPKFFREMSVELFYGMGRWWTFT